MTYSVCEHFIEVLKASSSAGRTVFLWKMKLSKSVAQNNTTKSCLMSTVNKTEYFCHFSRGFLDCSWDLDVFVFFFSFTSSLASKLQIKEILSTDFASAQNDKNKWGTNGKAKFLIVKEHHHKIVANETWHHHQFFTVWTPGFLFHRSSPNVQRKALLSVMQ